MHDVIAANPQYQAFDERIAEAEQTAATAKEQNLVLGEAYRQALADLQPGDPYPVAPEDVLSHGWIFGQRAGITGERGQWLADNYDAVEADFHQAEDKLLAKAAKVVAELDKLALELDELSSTANFVTMHAKRPQMIRHGAGNESAANLITAARTGRFLFREPYAVGGPRPATHVTHY